MSSPSHAPWLLGVGSVALLGCMMRSPAAGAAPGVDEVGGMRSRGTSALVGTWRLVEFWDRDSTGTGKVHQYGERPEGYFVYDATGHVFIQIRTTPAPPSIAPERGQHWFRTAPAEELRASLEGFRAYFGTYRIEAPGNVVVHEVVADSRRLYAGTRQRRPFRLVGDSLIFGTDTSGRRVLVRVR